MKPSGKPSGSRTVVMLNDRGFFVLLTLGGVAGAWGTYLAKWIASLLVASPLDQTVMAIMAVVAAYVALGVVLDYRKTI